MNNRGYVTDLRPYDVLFGRGSGANDHEGNIRFRQLVAERKDEYMATNHRMTKTKIAREIVEQIFKMHGRFLKRAEGDEVDQLGIPAGVDAWILVDDDMLMEKAKQALRQNTSKSKAEDEKDAIASPQKKDEQRSVPPETNGKGEIYQYDDLEPIPYVLNSNKYVVPPPQEHYNQARVDSNVMAPPQQISYANQRLSTNEQAIIPPAESSMLSHLPRNLQNRAYELSEIHPYPVESRGSIGGMSYSSRRSSIDMNELMMMHKIRSEGGDVHDLADSFSKAKIDKANDKKMYASNETMGTIDMNGDSSVTDMSFATMNSSTFSFVKGSESNFWGDNDKNDDSNQNDTLPRSRPRMHHKGDDSIKMDDFVTSSRSKSSSTSMGSALSRDAYYNNTNGYLAETPKHLNLLPEEPAPVDRPYNPGSMGESSMAMLKSMLMSTEEIEESGEDVSRPNGQYTYDSTQPHR